jgi:hypothetical protein
MSSKFARGAKAWGMCDACGFRYLLAKLKTETVAGRSNNLLVCPECWDKDHPQNWQGRYPVYDPQALRNPRPDTALEASREIPDNGQSIADLYVPPQE